MLADAPVVVLSDPEQAALVYHYPTSTAAQEWFRLRVWAKATGNVHVQRRIDAVEAIIRSLEISGLHREGDS